MKPNHLISETSPYLLQHAHNPVEWYAWGEAAFQKAKKEDKPVLVSIGYAACHWCHVMEHESFEDEKTAAFMNAHFVNIKVDREERMDVDHIYMQACQLLTGAGGWPLNMFLTPDLKPFTGGTYFPPKPAYGKASWLDVLVYVHDTFTRERDKVEEQAELLSAHILKMDNALLRSPDQLAATDVVFTKADVATTIQQLKKQFDTVDGGFGNAPKFPGSMNLIFLLRADFFHHDEAIKKHLELSLQHMMFGGIFDHAGGGFARYTVDKKWMVPHFEKMLYDNALLTALYAEAYMVTGNKAYAAVVEKTCSFLERELMDADGGFYASFDADSEGVEGKFYTWSWEEIETLTGDDMPFVARLYNITKDGNWEHTNILFRTLTDDVLCNEFNLTEKALHEKIKQVNETLFSARKQRIKPSLDDKIILSWNALTCSAYTRVYRALGEEHYKQMAERSVQFMLTKFRKEKTRFEFQHTYKNGSAKYSAFLEDYATLIQALIDCYIITGKQLYLQEATGMADYVATHFSDGVMYYFTHQGQSDIPLRSREFYDHATPSGNSVMLYNLVRLSALTGNEKYQERASAMFVQIKQSVLQYPSSFGNWLCGVLGFVYPYAEVVVTGPQAADIADEINKQYYPHITVQFDDAGDREEAVFENRFNAGTDQIYLCRNSQCLLPVTTVQDFLKQLSGF